MKAKEIGNVTLNLTDLGHADTMHIKVTKKDLIERVLYPDVKMNGRLEAVEKTDASRFFSEDLAIKAVQAALKENKERIISWTEYRFDQRLTLEAYFRNVIGEGIYKNTDFSHPYPLTGVRVILKLGYNSDFFEIVTAYPIANIEIKRKIDADKRVFIKRKKS